MSSVGQIGLNLTVARVMILSVSFALSITAKHFIHLSPQDVTWSQVLANQIKGRIHRRGQTLETFVFQIVCVNTVESLLIKHGMGKLELATDFLHVDRNRGKD